MYYLGIDIGSTTIKLYLKNKEGECIYQIYQRHFSDVQLTLKTIIKNMLDEVGNLPLKVAMTGSGGLSLSNTLHIPFIQEVIACTKAVEQTIPDIDVAIELGGEDAKITYFDTNLEQRMNGSCAGGTGAFIDQMATLLQTDAAGLNELAKNAKTLYPIASRCGVFAKTDIQPLINEGAAKEDIAASIFQAVVNQTISGLACGKPIKGTVAFLGGPLSFLSSLRNQFIGTLHLDEKHAIIPQNAQLFVALGASIHAEEIGVKTTTEQLYKTVCHIKHQDIQEKNILPYLFKNEKEKEEFNKRHHQNQIKILPMENARGEVYLGIDVGSTTSKVVVIDDSNHLLYSFYDNNHGNPLELIRKVLLDVYSRLPKDTKIKSAGVTGYGEALIKAAFKVDIGEVETIAHYEAAHYYMPDVDFILDIGGQDMKAIKIKNGVIDEILLNEACSSGCGSFIETFAESLNLSVEEFANEALYAKNPLDLGSRCTVFMNSKVKQAQKEGATISDISAGLSYSVIKNALYKVIKLRNKEMLGEHVIVQGGTFYNDAILKAFENETGIIPFRPEIAGLMGAFGMALIAKEKKTSHISTLISQVELENMTFQKSFTHCGRCTNNCALTITHFNDGREFISGNRCERGANLPLSSSKIPNGFDYKYQRIFNYPSLCDQAASRGKIGIPRVLNMYENYPFWHTFFTMLGFQVVRSPRTSKKIYEKGMDTIPSESVCYPAKLAHGHIEALIEMDVDTIFYPSVVYEKVEDESSKNHYNCPIVQSYPEVIKNNVDNIKNIKYIQPFLTLNDPDKIYKTMKESLVDFHISDEDIIKAIEIAFDEQNTYKKDIENKGQEILQYIKDKQMKGIVLAGRPYHVDPEINHGIAKLINSEGLAVLTEDMVSPLTTLQRPIRVVDQWAYHSRLYRAADFVSKRDDLELVQLTSFGCGLDAVTADQVQEILHANNKIYTLIKIDEGSNLGAIRIRIRSLKAAMKQHNYNIEYNLNDYTIHPIEFTKEMKEEYTILCPQLSRIHFQFFEIAAANAGYHLVVLPEGDKQNLEEGLRYVNNDACYPSILTIGQMMSALKSGKYDLNKTALIMSQTGGACRATNYISFIRKALNDAGYSQIPVISFNTKGIEKNSGFKLSLPLIKGLTYACLYGDVLMRLLYHVRPYETVKGSANALYEKWVNIIKDDLRNPHYTQFKDNVFKIVEEFDALEILDIKKPKVGLVGEILVKFSEEANNHIVDIIEQEGAEAVMPDFIDFFLYCLMNTQFNYQYLETTKIKQIFGNIGIDLIDFIRRDISKALEKSNHFGKLADIRELANKASSIVSVGNQSGEGWFLTGEMIELIESGVPNIVCMQPFGCLPNHVTGKGVIKALHQKYPQSNIVAIDYDPGVSTTNQLNRIKLMLATAFKNLK